MSAGASADRRVSAYPRARAWRRLRSLAGARDFFICKVLEELLLQGKQSPFQRSRRHPPCHLSGGKKTDLSVSRKSRLDQGRTAALGRGAPWPVRVSDVRPEAEAQSGGCASISLWSRPAGTNEGWRQTRASPSHFGFSVRNSSLDPVKRLLSPLLSALRNRLSDISYLPDGCLLPRVPPHGNPVTI